MFHDVPRAVAARMEYLEAVDTADRRDGTPQLQRLRQIPRETGRLLAILAAAAPDGSVVEVGTSAGYSALWLALACAARDRHVTTFEILPDKAELARQTFNSSGIADRVELVEGDARQHLSNCTDIGFCFLDAEKAAYAACYELVVPRLVPGGLLVADNVISHRDQLAPFIKSVLEDPRVDSVILPVGSGLLLARLA